jgi:hypothetical protein
LRGLNTQTTTIQMLGVTANTTLITVGENCRVEDVNMRLTSSGHYTLKGMYFAGSSSISSKLRTCVLTVDNSTASGTGTSNVYGVEFAGTGTLGSGTFSFNSLKGATINVYSNGNGKKRGVLVSNTNLASTRDLNIYVSQPTAVTGHTGSYVGVETADPANTGSIQLRSTTVGTVTPTAGQTYTASDILQTNPSTIANPTYLASAGIQVGPGVDLVTKTAGSKGFSTYNYPTTLFYGAIGRLSVSGVTTSGGYLWPGSVQTSSGGGQFVKYPDITTPPAYYRSQQPFILAGMVVNCLTAPGTGNSTTVLVRRTPLGGSIGDTVFTLTLTNSTMVASFYDASVTFGAGDYIHVFVTYNASGNTTADLSVQLDCF